MPSRLSITTFQAKPLIDALLVKGLLANLQIKCRLTSYTLDLLLHWTWGDSTFTMASSACKPLHTILRHGMWLTQNYSVSALL